MRQSNLYIVLYGAILTIVCGGLLALASEGLKEKQQANIDLEQKKNILATVMELKEGDNVVEIYNSRVKAFVIDYNGNVKEGMTPEQVTVAAEYKKPAGERLLPVYEIKNERDPTKTDNVVLRVYGYGLWNNIWGFVSLKSDFNTVQGVKFQHAGETPGLGARIESEEVQSRYKGKSIFDGDVVASIAMMKGEGLDYSEDDHKVDGMSGATLTGKGVNNMLKDYFACYEKYLRKNKK
ncbi:MAG: NADH:ubiquinone reductase (Na(+)-transporting) subunit C [Flammeovirgaceae bacterium]|nr:NADH:ubiquinone reductase (Na(+)-transporting) subunit C [Flammeovirgaceae bacterium]